MLQNQQSGKSHSSRAPPANHFSQDEQPQQNMQTQQKNLINHSQPQEVQQQQSQDGGNKEQIIAELEARNR